MPKFTAYVRTDQTGSRVEEPFEVPDDELDGLNDTERDEVIASYAQDAVAAFWEWGWSEDES